MNSSSVGFGVAAAIRKLSFGRTEEEHYLIRESGREPYPWTGGFEITVTLHGYFIGISCSVEVVELMLLVADVEKRN